MNPCCKDIQLLLFTTMHTRWPCPLTHWLAPGRPVKERKQLVYKAHSTCYLVIVNLIVLWGVISLTIWTIDSSTILFLMVKKAPTLSHVLPPLLLL